jgi:hypothetical protein
MEYESIGHFQSILESLPSYTDNPKEVSNNFRFVVAQALDHQFKPLEEFPMDDYIERVSMDNDYDLEFKTATVERHVVDASEVLEDIRSIKQLFNKYQMDCSWFDLEENMQSETLKAHLAPLLEFCKAATQDDRHVQLVDAWALSEGERKYQDVNLDDIDTFVGFISDEEWERMQATDSPADKKEPGREFF